MTKIESISIRRSVAIGLVSLVLMGAFVVGVPELARAGLCEPGWYLKSTTDDHFSWSGSGLSASWSSYVQVWEVYDRNCAVTTIEVDYTGSPSSGTIGLSGYADTNQPFVSFTVQSQPFTDYNHVADHEIGTLYYWSPSAGTYSGYTIEVFTSPYAEYLADSTNSAQKTITGVHVDIRLPLSYLGSTVYAEVFVGFNRYYKYNALYIPP